MAEPTRAEPDAARIIFYVAAVLMAIYGLGLLLFPQVMFNLTRDPGGAGPSWLGALGWWTSPRDGGSYMACCQQSREPEASRGGIGHSLHPDCPGFALQLACRGLPWSPMVELAADLGRWSLAAAMWWLSAKAPLPQPII